MLCLSWLLSVNKSFANSLENREWSLFHLITWGLSSVLTCTVLLNKNVDADELTGLCGVGFQVSLAICYAYTLNKYVTGFLGNYSRPCRALAHNNNNNNNSNIIQHDSFGIL